LLLPGLAWSGSSTAPLIKDGSQIRGIHQSWLVFAREFDGKFPRPSEISNQELKDLGGETFAPDVFVDQNHLDTTANLFSIMIMQNYISPELCVGPTEPSGSVFVHDDYNWDVYDPVANVHWDDQFSADLDSTSHVSYAHMPLFGENVNRHWRDTMSDTFPIVGNRGPKDGDDPSSITLKIHGSNKKWLGNIIFNDNHVVVSSEMVFDRVDEDGNTFSDHIFRFDQAKSGLDAILTFTKAMTEDGPVVQWD
ncbi:MAG: hypothetical protein O7G85_10105, partial [Planctomycetota bacterium]|nr:hypothetical protein [Planctomycetota bacterium]